jgi:tRNA nucleotidyltransferase/poly(A) polymerase
MPSLLDLFCEFAIAHGLAEDSFIVGGTVRDIVINKTIRDIDIAVHGDALAIGQAFAKGIKASFVLMDKKFGVARIVLLNDYLDICPVRGDSIAADLGERDITINALAIPLSGYLRLKPQIAAAGISSEIIDPFNGMDDIEKSIIRMISAENLISDPLRMLRVYRFACTLGFSIDPVTTESIKKLRALISSAASERITEELKYIIGCDNSASILNEMHESGLLTELFPNIGFVPKQAWHDVWLAYSEAEKIMSNPALYFGERSGHVEEFLRTGYRQESLKLSILLVDSKSAEDIFAKLRLSRKETEFIRIIFEYNKLISSLEKVKTSIVMALLRELGDNLYAMLVYILAFDRVSSATDSPVKSLMNDIIAIYQDEYIPRMKRLPLITGNDLIEKFSLSPSFFFRDILSAIELLALEGNIKTREEALRTAGEMISNKGFKTNP